ncbi:MAG: PqqD family protein [Deltaproteobacteria bacterium]|nr:PqqD family protein [Deltaproteobacteria bacterium]
MEENNEIRYRLRDDAARREVDGEFFIVTADRAMHRIAARSGVSVLRLLAERPHSVAELTDALAPRFDAEVATIRHDVETFVATLAARGIAHEVAS